MTQWSEGGNSGEIELVDRISNLPNSILAHILSFLPTKYAVATSSLSSGWKLRWTQVPVIDVVYEQDDFIDYGGRVNFQKFVDNLFLLNKETCLRFCRLIVPPYTGSQYIEAWIKAIATREVKEMHLQLWEPLEFPFCIFTCKKLLVLTLGTCGRLRVPVSVNLPNLRIINLFGFDICDGSLLRLLASGCPVLEELIIDDCLFNIPGRKMYLCSSTLKKFQITGIDGVIDTLAVIDLPSLEYFRISSCSFFSYDIINLSCLREADISLHDFSILHGYASNPVKLLNSVAGSTTLQLRQFKFKVARRFNYHQLPLFNNLTCLELRMVDKCCCFVPLILEPAPHLVNLILKFDPLRVVTRFVCSHVFHAPSCLSRSINTIEIQNFYASEEAVETVSYLLMNAKVLNEMKIYCSPGLSLAEEMKTKLLSFRRGSFSCTVSISSSS